ncbi:MAG: glycosyltransferase, partial [Terriglobia bacterium]
MQSSCSAWKTIGLTDPRLPALPDDISSLVDEVTCSVNPSDNGTPAVFLDGTPMTHDTRFSLRFLNHPAFFRAAVLYDFIPLDWPGYLPTVAHRIDYLGKLARLRKFDWFFPISEYTAWRASELLGAPRCRMSVTGAPVRRSVYELRRRLEAESLPNGKKDPYFLVVLAPDPRKNPELAIKAVRHLNLVYGRRIVLKIAGHYKDPYKRHLLGLACHAEGDGFLECCPSVSDEELASLYFGATATIAPSHIEGFSLPVVEASVCGSPVIASTCAAHLEL